MTEQTATAALLDRTATSRAGRRFMGALLLVAATLVTGVGPGSLAHRAWAGEATALSTVELCPGVAATVTRDGSILLTRTDGSAPIPLASILPPIAARASRDDTGDVMHAGVYAEGEAGGERGFSRSADDDGDGSINEDRIDGRDNDGDGLVDEDFAAIGERMMVVERMLQGGGCRLEAYHWSYPHLAGALFVNWERWPEAAGRTEPDAALLVPGAAWQETELTLERPRDVPGDVPGDVPEAPRPGPAVLFVASAPSSDGEQPLWLGACRLLEPPGVRGAPPARLDAERLELPFAEGRLRVAVAVAPTLLQLRHLMARAQMVYAGAPARPGEPRVPWIVPALRLAAHETQGLSAFWRPGERSATWELVIAARQGARSLVDPDRLFVDGSPLGSPLEIGWRSRPSEATDGAAVDDAIWRRTWNGAAPARLHLLSEADQDPYLGAPPSKVGAEAGELGFTFPTLPSPSSGTLQARLLTGRTIELQLAPPAAGRPGGAPRGAAAARDETPVVDAARQLRQAGRTISLASGLLENYPNPFRNQTRMRYCVPLTVGEGLVDQNGATPAQLDAQMAIPYRSSPPLVSLKIYSVSGHEIATLHHGNLSPGDYAAVWNGTDLEGRPVASGTYFCKLQIESWSVTKTVVFLR